MAKPKERLLTTSVLIVTFFMTICYLMSVVNPPLLNKLHQLSDKSAHKLSPRDIRLQGTQEEDNVYPIRVHVMALRRVWPPSIHLCETPGNQNLIKMTTTKTTGPQVPNFRKLIDEYQQNSHHSYNNGSVLLRFFDNILKSKLEVRFGRNEIPMAIVPSGFRIKIRTRYDQKDVNAENMRIKIAAFRSQDFLTTGNSKDNLINVPILSAKDSNSSSHEGVASDSPNADELPQDRTETFSTDNKTTTFDDSINTIKDEQKTYLVYTEGTAELPMFTATEIDNSTDAKESTYTANGLINLEEKTIGDDDKLNLSLIDNVTTDPSERASDEQNERDVISNGKVLSQSESSFLSSAPQLSDNLKAASAEIDDKKSEHFNGTQESPMASKDTTSLLALMDTLDYPTPILQHPDPKMVQYILDH